MAACPALARARSRSGFSIGFSRHGFGVRRRCRGRGWRLRFARPVKRSRALLGSNPTRNSRADGAPQARGPAGEGPRAFFVVVPCGRRSHALKNPISHSAGQSPVCEDRHGSRSAPDGSEPVFYPSVSRLSGMPIWVVPKGPCRLPYLRTSRWAQVPDERIDTNASRSICRCFLEFMAIGFISLFPLSSHDARS